MNTIRFTLLITLFIVTSNFTIAQQPVEEYDSALAKKLKADDYGMKAYVLVILKKGTTIITDQKVRDSIFHGHMANITRLANENKLLLAGPTGKNDKNYEGIFIYNTGDIKEAKTWLNSDPAIQSKDLDAEVYAWYGPAALQEVLAINKKLQKKHF
ncbi:MAG: hypothetical protein H0W12_11940 [Chitinophagaceae bacterium]|nr:hypothetical protein [Chitinophagaceae bacterium]